MNTDESAPLSTSVPLARDNELRLAKMRRQLETIHGQLDLAHQEVLVTAAAALAAGQPQLEKVLRAAVAHRLFGQLKSLKTVIEKLGGTTDPSEDDETTHAPPAAIAAATD